MKIKQVTFYALWALRNIYLDDAEIVTSNVIAEKENISQGVLLRILRLLSKQGIVEAHQGRGNVCGGFSLSKSIEDITLLEVIEAMEGEIDIYRNIQLPFREPDALLNKTFGTINQNLRNEFAKRTVRDVFKLK